MPKISIICAIYNAEKTIRRCLDSISNQTLKDFELILVDDGSTDNSGKICDDYAAQDSRIIVIHKNNEGVGATRACGIIHATGDYIIHVDPDDWIEQNALDLLYNTAIKNNAAITICDYRLLTPHGEVIKSQHPSRMDSIAMMNDILDGKLLGGVCNKLIYSKVGGG